MRKMSDPDRMAERLRYAMDMIGISSAELARQAGLHKSSITQYLHGVHAMSKESAERLAAILHVNSAWLMGYDVPVTNEEDRMVKAGGLVIRELNKSRFILVGNTAINMAHVITITGNENGVVVLLDTGTTVEGIIMDQ